MSRRKRKNIGNTSQSKKKYKTGNIFTIVFFICISLLSLYIFIFYNSLYNKAKTSTPSVICGTVDDNSEKFGGSHRVMPTFEFYIDGVRYSAPTKWLESSGKSVQSMLDELNSNKNAEVTYIALPSGPIRFFKEDKNEIIGLKIDGTEYLDPGEGSEKQISNYKESKNLCLALTVFIWIVTVIALWAHLPDKKNGEKT